MKTTSWQLPRTASPIIGIIDNGNDVAAVMKGYFKALTDALKD